MQQNNLINLNNSIKKILRTTRCNLVIFIYFKTKLFPNWKNKLIKDIVVVFSTETMALLSSQQTRHELDSYNLTLTAFNQQTLSG